MTDKIERGHVCEHGIRWPQACQPCDDAAWAQRDPKSPPKPVVSVEQRARELWAEQLRTAPAGEYAARSMLDSPSPHDERAIRAIAKALSSAAQAGEVTWDISSAQPAGTGPAAVHGGSTEPAEFREWLAFCIQHARHNPDTLDPKAAEIMENILSRYEAALSAATPADVLNDDLRARLDPAPPMAPVGEPKVLDRRLHRAAPPADGALLSDERDQILHGQLRESILDLRNHLTRNRDRDMAYVIKLLDAVVSDAHTRAAPKAPTAPIGEVGKGLREAVCAGLRAWIASTPDIDLSSRMISDATDFIIGQPLAERGGFEAGIEAAGKALDKLAADEDAAIAGTYDSEVTDRARCAIIAAEFRRAAKIIRQCKEHAAMQLRAYDRIKP